MNIIEHNFHLTRYLCSERVLKGNDDSCLKEKGDSGNELKKKKKKKKKKKQESKEKDVKEEL